MFGLRHKTKKAILIYSLTFFLIANFFAYSLFRPDPVYTAFPVTVVGSIPAEKEIILDKIGDSIFAAALGSLVNGASYFMRKFAYDTAKYVASGGKGQGALAFKDGFGSYLENTALDSVASSIEQFGEPFGLNLCKPPDLRIQLNIQVSLSNIYSAEAGGKGGPQPRCKWSDLKKNWSKDNLESMYGSRDALSERFATSLDVTEGDFGVALGLMGKIDRMQAKAVAGASEERKEGEGFKSVTNIISGKIKTPAQVIKKETEMVTGGKQVEMSTNQIAGIYGAGAYQILPMAASVFANTLVSTLLQNIMTNGLFPDDSGGGSSSIVDFYSGSLNYNRRVAERAFSYLVAGLPQHDITSYDIVSIYSACPDDPGLDNCVMDQDLAQAVQRANVGDPITIGEALDPTVGLLHRNWKLIPSSQEATNSSPQCYKNNYCFSNIQKLRKARILPLGFEIAVSKSSPDTPSTLGDAVDGFNDPDSKFYHLIDPNWILKAPEAQCESRVNGPELLSDNSSLRKTECVDFSTCLATDDDNSCKAFGYCTQEKNVWDLAGESCPDYYNTCKTYMGPDKSFNSYLSRTLDYGICNVESVGCRAYSTEQVDGEWVTSNEINLDLKAIGREQVLYFNDQIKTETCPSSEDGCSMFLYEPDPTKTVFLKEAPEYLGCYDTHPDTAVIDWPQTRADMVLLENIPEQCDNFAGACTPEEVSCESYIPFGGSNTITGIVGENFCPESCIGYETFKQGETNFESEKFPLYFVPSQGDVCASTYEGCDEFTNISVGEVGEGGEQLEYYSGIKYCERPDGDNAKTYYTWQGSETEGYVLKKHSLLQIDQPEADYIADTIPATANIYPLGSPAYPTDNPDTLTQKYNDCNQSAYNKMLDNPYLDEVGVAKSGCYALYDSSGAIYYRMLDDTVSVSDKCIPLRKTVSQMAVDTYLSHPSKQDLCVEKGGLWDSANNQCQRCAGGGFYQVDDISAVGSCIYWSIPEEATSCVASANGCRSYTGNMVNNVQSAHSTSFEPNIDTPEALLLAKQGWSGTSLSVEPEATQVGLYSLKVGKAGAGGWASREFAPGIIREHLWYEVTFWSRGNPHLLSVTIEQPDGTVISDFTTDPLTGQKVYVPVTGDWQEYTMGPVKFTGSLDATTTLKITSVNGNDAYFIDNFEIKSVGDKSKEFEYLIKDSWKTPEGYDTITSCDSNPNDGFPGEHLGCREYTARTGNTVQFSGFEKLCRNEAVGCVPLIDTQNYTDEQGVDKSAFNTQCRRGTGNPDTTLCEVEIGDISYKCTFPDGKDSCFVEGPVAISGNYTIEQTDGFAIVSTTATFNSAFDNLYVVTSTVIVEEDSDTIYLTYTDESSCNSEHLGCQRVALEEKILPDESEGAYMFGDDIFIKNRPLDYERTLCVDEQVGCNQYQNDENITFFKDPKLSGAGFCSYKDEVIIDTVSYSGWFIDGVGVCKSTTGLEDGPFCKNTEDCEVDYLCEDVGKQACYGDYLLTGNERGIWSNASESYEGYVGRCEDRYAGCTELVDVADISDDPDGKPYYAIYDDRLFSAGDCGGQVSQKEGCVLFDRTENPNKYYNSILTYGTSEQELYALVPPSLTGVLDTNELIKVRRDRECSEWLECRDGIQPTDERGVAHELCTEFKTCEKLDERGECASNGGWVTDKWKDNERLTDEFYSSREVGWNDSDYSGYSLFNKYPVGNYAYLLFFEGEDDAYVAYEMDSRFFEGEEAGFGCKEEDADENVIQKDGDECGFDLGGRCYKQKCLYPIDGRFDNAVDPDDSELNVEFMKDNLNKAMCKSYPEETSPFPIFMAVLDPNNDLDKRTWVGNKTSNGEDIFRREHIYRSSGFENANICQEGESGKDCSCEYYKIEYKNGTIDYWPRGDNPEDDGATGICEIGTYIGHPCNEDDDCRLKNIDKDGSVGVSLDLTEPASCSKIKQMGGYYGQKGLCLEYDLSRPLTALSEKASFDEAFACLTWLPIKISASSFDLYNSDPGAGYNPTYDVTSDGGELYCAEGTSAGYYYDESKFDFESLSAYPGSTYHEYFVGQEWYSSQDISSPAYATKNGLPCHIEPDHDTYHDCFIYDSNCDHVFIGRDGYLKVESGNGNNPSLKYNDVNFTSNLASNYGSGYTCSLTSKKIPSEELISTSYSTQHNGRSFDNEASVQVGENSTKETTAGLYKAMQAWAWWEIGSNAVVLRVENSSEDEPSIGAFYGTDGDYTVYTKTVNSIFGLAVNPKGETEDGGTLMHPPRIWDDSAHSSLAYFNKNHGHDMSEWEGADYASTVAFSPGPNLTETGNYQGSGAGQIMLNPLFGNGVYRSQTETYLNEKDLQQVYFVVTDYPNGIDGYNPALLVKDFYIDFSKLRDTIINSTGDIRYSYGKIDEINRGANSPEGAPIEGGMRLMYVLDSEDGVDFSEWDHNNYDDAEVASLADYRVIMSDQFDEVKDDPRNKIARRYVVMFTSENTVKTLRNLNAEWRDALYIDEDDTGYFIGGVVDFIDSNGDEFLVEERDPFNDSLFCEDSPHFVGVPEPIDINAGLYGDNMLAIGMDFNANGEFLGYVSRFCHTNDGNNGINFTVVAALNNQCIEYAEVYRDNLEISGETGKAWTDRVWADSENNDVNSLLHPFYDSNTHKYLTHDQDVTPFGSLSGENINSASFESLNNNFENAASRINFRSYSFTYSDSDGVPFSCGGSWLGGNGIYRLPTTSIHFSGGQCDPMLNYNVSGREYSDNLIKGFNTVNNLNDGLSGASKEDGEKALHSLFISYYSKMFTGFDEFLLPTFTLIDDYTAPGDALKDESGNPDYIDLTKPPRIFSINPTICARQGEKCIVGEAGNITINMRNYTMNDYDGDGTSDEDKNNNSWVDPIIHDGSYSAVAKFFAYADDNRMPIRRVMIDWGDGTDPTGNKRASFQNRKPYCSDSVVEGDTDGEVNRCTTGNGLWYGYDFPGSGDEEQLTCTTDIECERSFGSASKCKDVSDRGRFGDSDRACREENFTYGAHTYYCDSSDVENLNNDYVKTVGEICDMAVGNDYETWKEACERLKDDFKGDLNAPVCFFKPRVQVLDNWGWCNGSCDTAGVGNGCYVSSTYPGIPESPSINQCNLISTDYPWTHYKGAVIVIPQSSEN